MTDKRFEALEAKIAFLEDALEKLSDEFFEQQKEITLLQDQQLKLISQVQSLGESSQAEYYSQDNTDEKPPHY